MCADVAVRPLPAERGSDFGTVMMRAFGLQWDHRVDELWAELNRPDRRFGAFDGDDLVGTAAAFTFGLTLPGAAVVPAAAVTAVGVSATHRRRGILRQLMAAQLDEVAARGEPVAVLIASESGIYRRFGYGIATFSHAYELEPIRVTFREPVGAGFELRLMSGEEALAVVPHLYDRFRATRPGTFTLGPAWWRATLGSQETYIGGGSLFVVTCSPGPGHGGGYAVYTMTEVDADRMHLDVRAVAADDPVVEARLWRYLTEVDLVDRIRAGVVPVDCAVRWWLTDPRQMRVTGARDWLHLRILDVPAALSARRYPVDGELVVEVTDGFRPGPATDGRFALVVAGGVGRCEPTDRSPDLRLDVAALGSLLLGGVRAAELAPPGLVREAAPGAVERADRLFSWPVAPFCPTMF